MFILEQDALILYCLRAVLLGGIFAVGYLFLGFQRVLTERFPKPLRFTVQLLFDLVSWSGIAFADILMVYSANRGRVRILALLLQVAAFLICYLPLKKKVLKLEKALLRAIARKIILPVRTAIWQRMKEARIWRYHKHIDQRMQKDVTVLIDEIEKILSE